MDMERQNSWSAVLENHPIFNLPPSAPGTPGKAEFDSSLELSTSTLPAFTRANEDDDALTPSGRRQVMIIRNADVIVAAGREIRFMSLGDPKLSQSRTKSYKTLHTPNITFDIHLLAVNPSGKLLAVAGNSQVAVVVLPRSGLSRLATGTLECKSVEVGRFYHASRTSAPVAKVQWHPWGEAGSTLMVMTVDGKMREYDISVDTEEPQQVLTFVPERKSKSYLAEDPSEREVASFSLGKGKADWGPLTMYAVMRCGDVYAICPYMPKNASVPSRYVHALECFVAAKQEFLSEDASMSTDSHSSSLSTMYDYQRKYVNALLKQLPPGTVYPAASRSFLMHPPGTIKNLPARQGPYLLQPSPLLLEGSEGGDATDIIQMAFGAAEDEEGDGETERLGVVLIAYQDGRVDVCLDVEKVEARWEIKQDTGKELPMLAVYETIDLGLVSALSQASTPLELLQGNHPVLHADPIHEDVVYVYHAFGVHALNLGPLLQSLGETLRTETELETDDSALVDALRDAQGTSVQALVTTFSVERRCSNPVVAVAVPNDVYLTYSIFVLTSAMRIISFPLTLRSGSPPPSSRSLPTQDVKLIGPSPSDPPPFVSLLAAQPYSVSNPLARSTAGLPTNARLVLPPQATKGEFRLTPDTLRYLGNTVENFTAQIRAVQLSHREAEARAALQVREFGRQQKAYVDMVRIVEGVKGKRQEAAMARMKAVKEEQRALLGRMEMILRALMMKASPELSEHETKWFEELNRMKAEVNGLGKYDEGSLSARTRTLQREFERLLPDLKEVHHRMAERARKLAESTQGLGASQAHDLRQKSDTGRRKIEDIEEEVDRLASRLDVTLSRPPPLLRKGKPL